MFQSTRPRGARPITSDLPAPVGSFNPRAHVGRDETLTDEVAQVRRFNPRAHVGRDRRQESNLRSGKSFNPRAHVGRDTLLSQIVKFCQMFQSTRPRGARQSINVPPFDVSCVSIHAPTWGATLMVLLFVALP